jgi:glycine oxidase
MKVTVVGGGIIGYAVAYELAARGADVRLIDPRGGGQGATRASAGILAPHIEAHSAEFLRLALDSLDRYDSFIARVSADAQRVVEYRRSGTLQVACSDADARTLSDAAQSLAGRGASHTLVDGDGARELEPALGQNVRAALMVPDNGYVGVATLMSALKEASTRRGARLEKVRVDRIDADGTLRVQAGPDSFESDALVVAAGSWSGGIPTPSTVPVPVRPVRGQLLQLRFDSPPFTRIVWGSAVYLVPWLDGNLLAGATVEEAGFDERVTVAGVTELLEAAAVLLPGVQSAEFVEARAGLRPATSDQLPIVGCSSKMRGVYYATGHYRNGVLLAPSTASLLADLILDGRQGDGLDLMRPDRFGL